MAHTAFDGSLSTISNDSMVEIKHDPFDQRESTPSGSPAPGDIEERKHRLVYSKSKVYINPTAYARDNIPGFVALVKREAATPTYLLAWIPEKLLNEKGKTELEKWVKVEEHAVLPEEEDDDVVLVDIPNRPESYAFSVPLTSIYSLDVRPPTLSSWYGSIQVNLISGSTLPTLYFHDDESRSFSAPTPTRFTPVDRPSTAVYPPPQAPSAPSWGGEDFLGRLRSYAHIMRSTLQPTLYLLDPSRTDIEAHTTQLFDDDAVDNILAQSSFSNSHSPIPAHRRPRPLSTSDAGSPSIHSPVNPYSHRVSVLHRSMPPASPMSGGGNSLTPSSSQARMALLQSFSNITRATRHAAQNILSHPLAKPIVPHLPDPVKTFVNAPGEWSSWVEKGGMGEFESARVYLARWARVVAEEGERARRKEGQAVPTSAGATEGEGAEETSLGVFELLHSTTKNLPPPRSSRDPRKPVNEMDWEKWFGPAPNKGKGKAKEAPGNGKPTVRMEEVKREIFRRGIHSGGTLRKRLWPFILGVKKWDATDEEREQAWAIKSKQYRHLKAEWCGVKEVFERPDVVEERHRIDVDCRRTDRTQPFFSAPSPGATTPVAESGTADEEARRFSVMSPNFSDIGAQSPSNEHIERLAAILLTYNFYEKELGNEGYVQGMSDLAAPLYVVTGGDEELTFWCFVSVMDRMKRNFLRDQSGMKQQLLTLQQLIGVMDPELYRHLEKTDGLNLFFCFRWVLILFKREFPFDDILRLWEVLWTDYYSNDFVLFVALAVLESHRDIILRYLVEFDEILKYCNELSMTIELDSTLAQAEVLFLSFAQLAADIDRRNAEANSASMLRKRHTTLKDSGAPVNKASSGAQPQATTNSTDVTTSTKLPELSSELRELLKAGR